MENAALSSPYSKMLSNYAGIIWCSLGGHINQKIYCCKKEKNMAYLCIHCRSNSKHLTYLYKCDICEKLVCLTHFKDHCMLNSLEDKFGAALDCSSSRLRGNDLDKISRKECKILGRCFHSSKLRIIKEITATSVGKIYAATNTKNIKELGTILTRPKLEYIYCGVVIIH